MMRKPTSLATALIMLALLFALVPLLPQPAQAHPGPWWDTDWQYRMLINITENSGSTLTNYQVPITLTTTTFNYSKADASGDDIRFATDGTECDYWIETWNTGGTSTIWVEVPSLTASSTTTIYMYYGNSGASAGTSYDNTFTKSFGESGLAGLWHMDEGSGSTTADSSGNGNTGTLSGATWVASDGGQWDGRSDVGFSTGKSLSFDGSNDMVTVNDSSSLDITGDITIAVWIKPDTRPSGCTWGDYEVLVSKRVSDSFTTNYQIYLEDDGRKFSYWDGSSRTGSFVPPTGSWSYLVAVVNDGASQVKLYANGALQDTLTGNTGAANNYALCIGGAVQSITCNEPFHGIIDEVRIYNRALSQAEIQRYYQWSKYASTEPTVNPGQEESTTSWMDYFGGTAAISSLANVAVSDGDVVLNTPSLSQGLDPADFNGEYTFNHDNPAQEMSGFTLSQAIDSVDELQIYVVTAAAGYNAKIAIFGPQNTPPSGAPLRMYTVSFNLGNTGWVGAALDPGSPQTSIPAGNYWFAVIEDDYAHSTATTMRDTTCTAGYNGCSWYRTTMFTWPNFPSTLPSLTHSSSGYYGVYRITYSGYNTLGNLTSTAIMPEILSSWGNFTASHTLPTGTDISYKILKASDDSTLCTITAAQAAAGYDISSCAGATSSIKLYAELSTTGSNTPTLHDWNVTWSTNTPPTVDEPVVTSSMTPQSQAWVNVTITDNNTLSDLANVTTVLFYDTDGSYTNPGASPDPDTQTLAIMTWYASNDTFTIQSGSPSTWSINNTTSTHPVLTGTTGDWKFSFQPGKVATETTSSAKWFARVNATDSANLVGSNHTTTGSDMNWYGEITVGTSNISWGTVTPGCSNNMSPVVNITYICNGNYSEQVKTSQNWTSALGNVALNATGSPGAGEFSLKADDDDTIADAVQVLSASYTTFDSGTQTTEAGNVENNNHLWLSLGLGIPVDTYSGTIYFGIAL